jgi:alpha-tubulin suppressor-like RCC1 family protein
LGRNDKQNIKINKNNKMKKLLSFINLWLATFTLTQAQIVSTLAGTGSIGSANSVLPSFTNPAGVCTDAAGNVYVADAACHKIRKITPAGEVTTLAGSGAVGADDGIGNLASFNTPYGICINPQTGSLIVSDRASHTIREVTLAGVVTTLAGGAGIVGTTDNVGILARFNLPSGVWANAAGHIFVGDYNNGSIRKIVGNVVSTYATTGGTPTGVTGDAAGNIFVVNRGGNSVLKINTSLVVSTYATGFNDPLNICIDGSGNLYVTNFQGNNIQKITALNTVSTFATVNSPLAIGISSSGDFFVSQFSNHQISKVTAAGVVSPYSGTGVAGCDDTNNSIATFNSPTATCVDAAGNVFVADQLNHLIRKITPAGVVSTVAGTSGVAGYLDATGTAALFNKPNGICVDAQNNLYVSEYLNHTVRKITSAGVVSTLAGMVGVFGAVDATGTAASFSFPGGLCMDDAGFVYLADRSNMKIRKIDTNTGVNYGVVTTFAGTGTVGSANGTRLAATFNFPSDITFDKATGNFYVSDEYSHQIRKISPAGMVSTVAGSGAVGNADGAANLATFDRPSGIFVDANCNIFVTQYNGNVVRKVDANGVVSTYAGSSTPGFVNGIGTAARFTTAFGIDGDGLGNLYVADLANHAVRKITTAADHCAWRVVSTGGTHVLAIKADGTLWAWGNNEGLSNQHGWGGQIGNCLIYNSNKPLKIGNENDWVNVSAGGFHSLALKSDGSLWAFGSAWYGQLGYGGDDAKCSPIRVGPDNDWVTIETGTFTSFAIKQNGTLWAWGWAYDGQLGTGTQGLRYTPTQVGIDQDWLMVSTRDNHTLALKRNGTLWAWGKNDYGQLGNNTLIIKLVPTQIGNDTWKNISAGGQHSLAIKSNGTLWAWGNNFHSELGNNGVGTTINTPTLISSATDWVDISASYRFSSGLRDEGASGKTLWVWGSQYNGEFGNGTNYSTLPIPTQIGSASNIVNTLVGTNDRITLSNTGELFSTGFNFDGQLGTGNNTSVNIPTPVICTSFPQNRCYVNKTATGLNNGMSWANAFVSLDDALLAARSNGVTEIWVAKGVYKPSAYPQSITGSPTLTNRDFTFHLVDGVKMYGGFVGTETAITQRVNILANETILSGDLLGNDGALVATLADNCYHVVISVSDNNCTLLDGFTISGGNADGSIFNQITVEGGGVNNAYGGAMLNANSSMKIDKVNFIRNYGFGGILGNLSCPLILVTNSVFSQNSSSGNGSAMANLTSNVDLINSVFAGNYSNEATIVSTASLINITNSTFNSNTSVTTNKGLSNSNNTTVTIKNSILNDAIAILNDGTSTTTVNNSIIAGSSVYPGTGNLNLSPTFENTANLKGADGVWRTADDGLRLKNNSPGINSGSNVAVLDILFDINGADRIVGNIVDMGAYEYTACIATINGLWNDPAIWSCGHVPTATDNAVIASGVTVTVPAGTFPAHSIQNMGNITFLTGGNIVLYP